MRYRDSPSGEHPPILGSQPRRIGSRGSGPTVDPTIILLEQWQVA